MCRRRASANPTSTRSIVNEEEKTSARVRAAEALGLSGPEKVELVVLPAAAGRLAPMTSSRKKELAQSIESEFYARKDRTKVRETPTPLDEASLLEVCGTCRGACCRAGEDHAFLTRAVLARVKRQRRVATDASLLESYLQRVPEEAVEGSCIYHGARGCALPRTMRSETCNRFLCYPLKQLGRDFSRPGYAQIAVSTAAEKADRVLVLSEGTARTVDPESWDLADTDSSPLVDGCGPEDA